MIPKSIDKVVHALFAVVVLMVLVFAVMGLVQLASEHKTYYNKPYVNQKTRDLIFQRCINTPCVLKIDGVEFNIEVNKGGEQ